MIRHDEYRIEVAEASLATTVLRPAANEPSAVVLVRTPYGRSHLLADGAAWVRSGIAAVLQDVRGRHDSTGRFAPYESEGCDGAATIDWIRDQAWSDGRVVLSGSSYAAHCALASADLRAVSGITVAVPALGATRAATEPSGVGRLYSHLTWWATFGATRTDRGSLVDLLLADDPSIVDHLPLATLPERLGIDLPEWTEVLAGPREPLPGLRAVGGPPLLVVAGLHDVFLADALELWDRWRAGARLLVGPWSHLLRPLDTDELARSGDDVRPGRTIMRFVQRALAGEVGDERLAAVATSGAAWVRARERWPGGEAAVESLDRWDLMPRPDVGSEPDGREGNGWHTFTADPMDPFPSRMGPEDVSVDFARDDVLRLISPPVACCERVAGSPTVTLRVNTETPGDWFVRLSVTPSTAGGPVRRLAEGVVASSASAGGDVSIELTPLHHDLVSGERLLLEISGHNHPIHVRSLHGPDPLHGHHGRASHRRVRPADSTISLVRLPLDPTGGTADPAEAPRPEEWLLP